MSPRAKRARVVSRVLEAEAALRDALSLAVDLAPDDLDDVGMTIGDLELAALKLESARGMALGMARDAGDEDRVAIPWRTNARAWGASDDLVGAVEDVLRDAGSMGVHPGKDGGEAYRALGGTASGRKTAIHGLVTGLAVEVHRHLEHPGGFDERLLLHRAISAAVALRLADAGSAAWLAAYGVAP